MDAEPEDAKEKHIFLKAMLKVMSWMYLYIRFFLAQLWAELTQVNTGMLILKSLA